MKEIITFPNIETLLNDLPPKEMTFPGSSSIYFYNILPLIITLGHIWFYQPYYKFLEGDDSVHSSILHITTRVVFQKSRCVSSHLKPFHGYIQQVKTRSNPHSQLPTYFMGLGEK